MPPLIPPPELYSLLLWFAPCFTEPSFAHFVSFITCCAAGLGRLTATTVYRSSPRESHWTNYSRFLSAYRWSVQQLSARLLALLVKEGGLWRDDQGRSRLCFVLDETIVEKSSRRLSGVAWHHNSHGGCCRGSHILGHYWLMLGLLIRLAAQPRCCPLAFRLYRQKKRCPAAEYRTPCQLARALLESLPWPLTPKLVRTVIADAGFADSELMRWCVQEGIAVITRGRIDARVHDLFVQQSGRGRPRKWGPALSLKEFAADEGNFTQTIPLYQDRTPVQGASLVGRHRQSGLVLRFVILRVAGKAAVVLMSTDLSLTPREIAQLYAARFQIELTFRELKQHFGMGHYQVRKPLAILRHVHLAGLACALTQLLSLQGRTRKTRAGRLKATPWRRSGPPSVYEAQLRLRLACQRRGLLGKWPSPGHLRKTVKASRRRSQAHNYQRKSAEL